MSFFEHIFNIIEFLLNSIKEEKHIFRDIFVDFYEELISFIELKAFSEELIQFILNKMLSFNILNKNME